MGAPVLNGPFVMPMFRSFVPRKMQPWIYLFIAVTFQLSGGVYLGALNQRFIHIHILPDFPAFFRLFNSSLPQFKVLAEYGSNLLLHARIVHPYLHQQVVIID